MCVCVCVCGGGGGVEWSGKIRKVSTVYYDIHYSQAPPRFLWHAVQYTWGEPRNKAIENQPVEPACGLQLE